MAHVPGGFRVTKLGEVASGLDLLFVRQAVRRIESSEAADYREVAGWAVEDYLAEEKYKEKWLVAVRAWLDEVDVRKIAHPARYRGDFEQRIEDLARVCLLYEKAAEAIGKPGVANAVHTASLCLRYGVAPEVVPIMALGFSNLRRTQEVHQARAVATADREESEPELDELISRFRLDPAALS